MPARPSYRIFDDIHEVDIAEDDIRAYDSQVLDQLLIDHTMSARLRAKHNDPSLHANIFWATADYSERGAGYGERDQIQPQAITGAGGRIVMPRVLKDKELQQSRVRDKAEVFTPSWVCNAQNNLIDEAWFGRPDVFNHENADHTWTPVPEKIVFPEGDRQKTWQRYVTDNRMEITCGEAPYLVSRYDTTTGEPIPIDRRIGLLDRKLRVVSENTTTSDEWLRWARRAVEHCYGYEWQGDSLLLAREAVLYTFIEYYINKFNTRDAQGRFLLEHVPQRSTIRGIARVISWNLWQMDGLRMVIPGTCDEVYTEDFFGEAKKLTCLACKNGQMLGHIGVVPIIRDWSRTKPKEWKPLPGEDPKSSPWQKLPVTDLFKPQGNDVEEQSETLNP